LAEGEVPAELRRTMPDEKPQIIIDEGWKEQAAREKERLAAQQAGKSTAAPVQERAPASSGDRGESAERPPLSPASLATLISSLATQALMMLGQVADPQSGQAIVDIEYARHLIDTLAVLEDKTAGRRTPEESRLLDNVLHDLRMTVVAVERHLATASQQPSEESL
jgi:hypothetical protein